MDPPHAPPALSRIIVLIPAFQPTEALLPLVGELASSQRVKAVVVVNDGSDSRWLGVFRQIELLPHVYVLHHSVNLGKGSALKSGLNLIVCTFPDAAGVVTADADGQHSCRDILRTVDALTENPRELILGARTFDTEVPLRSKAGNLLTRSVMHLATGQDLHDTQTGLRGIPIDFIPRLLRLKTTGYDFELDMLLACRRDSRRIRELPVSTIYIDGNRSSHFDPLLDSMRVYFVFLRFAAVSLLTAGLDNLVFVLAMYAGCPLIGCQAVSRLSAGSFNYLANRRSVFHSETRNKVAIPRYWLSVLVSAAVSYVLMHNLMKWSGSSVIPAKIGAEAILFVFSFAIQRRFVFSHSHQTAGGTR